MEFFFVIFTSRCSVTKIYVNFVRKMLGYTAVYIWVCWWQTAACCHRLVNKKWKFQSLWHYKCLLFSRPLNIIQGVPADYANPVVDDSSRREEPKTLMYIRVEWGRGKIQCGTWPGLKVAFGGIKTVCKISLKNIEIFLCTNASEVSNCVLHLINTVVRLT